MTFYTLDEICKSFVDFNGNIDDIFRRIYVDDIPTTYFVTCDGRVFNKYDNLYREIKGVEIKKGYLIVLIYYNEKSGKRTRKRFYVHRLVAKAFIPIPENYIKDGYTEKTLTVNHKQGKYKDFNHVTNLEWATQKEQMIHANKTGLCHPKCGEDNVFAKLKEKEVREICESLKKNEKSMVELAKQYNTTRKNISMIYHKKRWKKIANEYDFSNFNKTRACDPEKLRKSVELILENKLSLKEISKRTGIRYDYLWKISKNDNIELFYKKLLDRSND